MNWLCPITFWSDDCLSHGTMFWIGIAIIILIIILFNIPLYKCSGCGKKMKKYYVQALTNEGDKFYCKECYEKYFRLLESSKISNQEVVTNRKP